MTSRNHTALGVILRLNAEYINVYIRLTCSSFENRLLRKLILIKFSEYSGWTAHMEKIALVESSVCVRGGRLLIELSKLREQSGVKKAA